MKQRFAQAICGLCEHCPETVCDSFARDFGARFIPGHGVPLMVDSLLNAPFESWLPPFPLAWRYERDRDATRCFEEASAWPGPAPTV